MMPNIRQEDNVCFIYVFRNTSIVRKDADVDLESINLRIRLAKFHQNATASLAAAN